MYAYMYIMYVCNVTNVDNYNEYHYCTYKNIPTTSTSAIVRTELT